VEVEVEEGPEEEEEEGEEEGEGPEVGISGVYLQACSQFQLVHTHSTKSSL
jgi:hypothetical protein